VKGQLAEKMFNQVMFGKPLSDPVAPAASQDSKEPKVESNEGKPSVKSGL